MTPLDFTRSRPEEMRERADALHNTLSARRSVRHFSTDPIPLDVLKTCIATAGMAPSGANKQPWTFVLVTDPVCKARIREGAEREETTFYAHRASERWLSDLAVFETDANKPMLEDAPALIAVFAQKSGENKADQHYYVQESVGIAVGFLIAAIHLAGLACLVHTPSPMRFLNDILDRPPNERPFLLIPVGFPEKNCVVPTITRKPLSVVLVNK